MDDYTRVDSEDTEAAAKSFPRLYWPELDQDVTFVPAGEIDDRDATPQVAVIVHAGYGDQVVLADIVGRGVCTPSGRIEPGETAIEAAVRETYEECGAVLNPNRVAVIGFHVFTPRSEPFAGQAGYCPVVVAEVVHFAALPVGSESRGFILMAPENVADNYYMWDELIAAEFEFAWDRRRELFPPGISLRAFMNGETSL